MALSFTCSVAGAANLSVEFKRDTGILHLDCLFPAGTRYCNCLCPTNASIVTALAQCGFSQMEDFFNFLKFYGQLQYVDIGSQTTDQLDITYNSTTTFKNASFTLSLYNPETTRTGRTYPMMFRKDFGDCNSLDFTLHEDSLDVYYKLNSDVFQSFLSDTKVNELTGVATKEQLFDFFKAVFTSGTDYTFNSSRSGSNAQVTLTSGSTTLDITLPQMTPL